MNPVFLSRSSTYRGDYECLLRTPKNEIQAGLHYHDFYEIVIYLGNAGIFQINGNEYLIGQGDIVLINMFDSHTLKYNKHTFYERFSISIDPSLLLSFNTENCNLLDIFSGSSENYPIFHVEGKCFDKYLNLIHQYSQQKPRYGQDIYEKAMLHQLASYLYSDCFTGIYHDTKESRHIALVAALIDYINTHLSEELSLDILARHVNYSPYYISRIFKNITSYTLTNYIIEKRISLAKQYITSNMSISQAAEAAGFHNYSYFYKTFCKFTGKSPADYKNELI